jgi:hypothetical protein
MTDPFRRRVVQTTDPQELSVQISFRVPFWYREQLRELSGSQQTLNELIVAAVTKVHTPRPPKRTADV